MSDLPSILDIARQAGRIPTPVGRGGSEHLIQCPWAERHKNGDSHPSCRLNSEKNTFYCDPCGQGGGVLDLAKALGVESERANPAAVKRAAAKRPLVFVDNGPVGDEIQRHFADVLGKRYPPSTWEAFGAREGTVHPEGIEGRGDRAVAFPLPGGGFHVYRYLRSDKKKRWVFANGGKADLITAGLDRDGVVILAEGEWDAMTAFDVGFAVATGTGAGTFKPEWGPRLAGRDVAVVYDVDPAGQEGSAKAVAGLGSHPTRKRRVDLPLSGDPEADGKDLSDYLALHSVDDFLALLVQPDAGDSEIAGSAPCRRVLPAQIDAVLSMDMPIRLKRREAARLVLDDLRTRGELVRTAGGRLFWFDREGRRLYDLEAFPFRALFLRDFEINPAEREFAHVFEAVKSAAREIGRRVTVCRFCHYDRTANQLYIHGGPGFVLRLNGSTIDRVDNGTDDVIFEDIEHVTIPEEALTRTFDGDPVGERILDRVNFIRGAGVVVDAEHQRLVLRIWMLAVFFPELMPARVLLLLYGEKGSGKTTTLRVILKLYLGPTANVTPLTQKEDGFNAAVTSEYLLVIDNADSHSRWLEDRLATVATGQTIRLRKLYTTNEMLSFPTRCCIALTARTPRFRRDDVVDRLQILKVERLNAFAKESDWYAEVEEHRADLWAQVLRDLNRTLVTLGKASAESPGTVRMADWASLAAIIGDSLGEGDAIRGALEASELVKAQFLLEADAVYDLLHAIATERPNCTWKAGELFAELKRRSEDAEITLSIKSPRSLGRILHRLEPALGLMIRFEIVDDPHDGQSTYLLGPLPPSGTAGKE
jgi:hypothetical protein